MVFSSLIFIFRFMILFFAVYYLAPARARNAVLFAGSLLFYAWGEPRYLVLILLSVLINYWIGLGIGRARGRAAGAAAKAPGDTAGTGGYPPADTAARRRGAGRPGMLLVAAVLYNIGMLALFKYADFALTNLGLLLGKELPSWNLSLPLGISFYTFQILSYVIDVYRGKVSPEGSLVDLGTYLCMFPQLIAGPIVVYGEVRADLHGRECRLFDVEEGLKEFTLGLGSKVLLANQAGALWNELSQAGFDGISTPAAWLGVLAYSLQIYFDFNGYSLMAVGLGRMMGFHLPFNFNYPYLSKSVSEFWRRWHITLGAWFREYLYIPLGGSRRGKGRTVLNLLIVWLATGLWHGAGWNFVCWGLYYFVLIAAEKLFLAKALRGSGVLGRIFSRCYTLLAVGLGWVIFAMPDFAGIKEYFSTLFALTGGSDWTYYISRYGGILLAGVFFSTPVFRRWFDRMRGRFVGILTVFVIFWLSVYFLVDSAYNPFLYFYF